MYDLFSFYRSDEWRRLLKQLRLERLNDQGEIICDYCGKPITRAYDLIGHHVEELTEENVNDFNISLNPNNIQFVHHRCHNYIHSKLGYSMREVYLVYGAPMAGKCSWVKDNAQEGDLIINIDDIWECVSGCERFTKPNRLKAVVFKVYEALLDAVKYRLGRWNNAYIIGGFPLQSERERLCRDLAAREIFIDASQEECLARLAADDIRSKIDGYDQFILDWFARYSPPIG